MSAPASAADWLAARPVAHRGLHDAALGVVENTPTAGQVAARAGFAIECDVQLSADGEAVVFHDFTLDRLTTGQGRVDDLSVAELAALSYKGSTDRIVTLDAYLDLIGGRVPLIVEIKSRFDGDLRLTRRTADIVNRRSEPVALMSFDPDVVEALRALAPDRPRGVVAEAAYTHGEWQELSDEQRHELTNFLHIDRSRPDFIAWHVKDLPHTTPALARHFGLPVLTWTVRSPDDREAAARFADQIIFEGFHP
ncbi:glycerophosphodiester phosphodiesterase family protein [Pseudochelatococcus lubricantis]|uniref:glycerophosphodiester phosphodiesterase family protein n=1 Tax=Pseudochelatococcus lubricantis TaxID=1538102 RepID=UPI0035E6F45F